MSFILPTINNENKKIKNNENSNIKKIIAIMSGKGGVGKSTICACLASQLNYLGYSVGILDADITGPSQPKIFGINNMRCLIENNKIQPIITKTGIKLLSVNLLVNYEDDAIIWRAPLLNKIINQFFLQTKWEELDFLLIDLPPGTSDVPINVIQKINVDGFLIISTPQDLVQLIVNKSINMAHSMNANLYGIVENMSYFKCPDNNKIYKIFGEINTSNTKNTNIIHEIPILPELNKACDKGLIEDFIKDNPSLMKKIINIIIEK